MTARDTAKKVLGAVALGAATVVAAIGIVATSDGTTERAVTEAVRTTRYVLYNASNGPPPGLCSDAGQPADVECVEYGWTAEAEAARNKMLAGMGTSISALPAVMVYAEEEVALDDAGTVEVRKGWREYRVADLPREQWTWKDGAAPQNRRSPVAEWALLKATPPPVVLDEVAP